MDIYTPFISNYGKSYSCVYYLWILILYFGIFMEVNILARTNYGF